MYTKCAVTLLLPSILFLHTCLLTASQEDNTAATVTPWQQFLQQFTQERQSRIIAYLQEQKKVHGEEPKGLRVPRDPESNSIGCWFAKPGDQAFITEQVERATADGDLVFRFDRPVYKAKRTKRDTDNTPS